MAVQHSHKGKQKRVTVHQEVIENKSGITVLWLNEAVAGQEIIHKLC